MANRSLIEIHAALRSDLGLNSAQAIESIALEVGRSPSTVNGWLSGRPVPINTLKWLNAAFKEEQSE